MNGPNESPTPLTCTEAVERLWDYLDRTLPAAEVDAVEAHLAECRACPRHYEFERRLLAELHASWEGPGASALLRARVMALVSAQGHEGKFHG